MYLYTRSTQATPPPSKFKSPDKYFLPHSHDGAHCAALVFDIWLREDLTPQQQQGGRTVILTKGEEEEEGGEVREDGEQHG